jgi:hypothetical protein
LRRAAAVLPGGIMGDFRARWRWLDRVEDDARSGNERSRLILAYTARALEQLRNLPGPPGPEDETATLRQVRQSRRYQL